LSKSSEEIKLFIVEKPEIERVDAVLDRLQFGVQVGSSRNGGGESAFRRGLAIGAAHDVQEIFERQDAFAFEDCLAQLSILRGLAGLPSLRTAAAWSWATFCHDWVK
jgi:hypothetical protein